MVAASLGLRNLNVRSAILGATEVCGYQYCF